MPGLRRAAARVRLRPPGRRVTVAQVLAQVKRLVAHTPEVSAADRTTFIAQQTKDFDTLITMVQVLLALAILIAVLGVVNTLALSVLERTRELGLLRAVGLGRGQTMRMITVEAVVISVFGALLGVTVGAGLGAAGGRALPAGGHTHPGLPGGRVGTYLGLAGGGGGGGGRGPGAPAPSRRGWGGGRVWALGGGGGVGGGGGGGGGGRPGGPAKGGGAHPPTTKKPAGGAGFRAPRRHTFRVRHYA